jgi:hypothetical protein
MIPSAIILPQLFKSCFKEPVVPRERDVSLAQFLVDLSDDILWQANRYWHSCWLKPFQHTVASFLMHSDIIMVSPGNASAYSGSFVVRLAHKM